MTLALIAGTGDLPPALVKRLPEPPLVCAVLGFDPAITPDVTFRLEHLGSFLKGLRKRGVTRICMAGSVRRPPIDPRQIDFATLPLVPKIMAAMGKGDDGALRAAITVMENAGFQVVAAHEVAPDLLPPEGVATRVAPGDRHHADAAAGEACIAAMGKADIGQACILRGGRVIATEDAAGTDAMIAGLGDADKDRSPAVDPLSKAVDVASDTFNAFADMISGREDAPTTGGILFKAPKPNQDRRADLPVIGPLTAMRAAEAGLDGIVIEAGGVMVLEQEAVRQVLDAQGLFLWVRPRGGA